MAEPKTATTAPMIPLTSFDGAAVVDEDSFGSGIAADRVRTVHVVDGDDADDSDDSDELDSSVDICDSFLDILQR